MAINFGVRERKIPDGSDSNSELYKKIMKNEKEINDLKTTINSLKTLVDMLSDLIMKEKS